jgi:hypothetical protein
MFTIRYNRTTNHIAGIGARTTGGGNEVDGAITYYAQNACGTLTRGRLAEGASYESLAEALEAARKTGGRKLCKTCEKAAEAALEAAEAPVEDEVTETPKALTFKRMRDALERMTYVAESERFRYNVRSAGKGLWEVEVWSLKLVGEIDPVVIADKQIASLVGVSYADAKAEAEKYEAEHTAEPVNEDEETKTMPDAPKGAQEPAEPRIKFKVDRILSSGIVTGADGSKVYTMLVEESVRGPVRLTFPESEALWLFADIMDNAKEFRAWQQEE